jgi:hypothetical protein
VRPDDWWIYQLYNQASYQGCAVFIKDNVRWFRKIKEFPKRGLEKW